VVGRLPLPLDRALAGVPLRALVATVAPVEHPIPRMVARVAVALVVFLVPGRLATLRQQPLGLTEAPVTSALVARVLVAAPALAALATTVAVAEAAFGLLLLMPVALVAPVMAIRKQATVLWLDPVAVVAAAAATLPLPARAVLAALAALTAPVAQAVAREQLATEAPEATAHRALSC
jgi:hypothetical protein